MTIERKPINFVAKQLQSKRYHVKKQDNKRAYNRERAKKEFRKDLKDIIRKETTTNRFLKIAA